MEFDKSKVYTVLNADELKIGSKAIVADNLLELKECVLKHRLPKIIMKVQPEDAEHRFLCNDDFNYALAYLISESEEKKLKTVDEKLKTVDETLKTTLRLIDKQRLRIVELEAQIKKMRNFENCDYQQHVMDCPVFKDDGYMSCKKCPYWILQEEIDDKLKKL